MKTKKELIDLLQSRLNPKYENDVFTWKQIKDAINPTAEEKPMEKENGVDKVEIILDKKKYEIGKLFTLEQLKILGGVNNNYYGICLVVSVLQKSILIKHNWYGNPGNPDYEIVSNEVHDAGWFLFMGMTSPLTFYSFNKTMDKV